MNGSSIGFNSSVTSGALGCFGLFQDAAGSENAVRCFLTVDSIIEPNNNATGMAIEWPSAQDLSFSITDRERVKAEAERDKVPQDPQVLDCLQWLQSRRADASIGTVICRSGRRANNNNRRMDWAIVALTNPRIPAGPNIRPERHEFPAVDPRYGARVPGRWHMLPKRISNFGPVIPHSWVAKIGRTTNVTMGTIWQMHRSIAWQPAAIITEEWEFGSEDDDVAAGGDSGSIIIDSKSQIVGMVIARQVGNRYNNAFVFKIQDVLDDIETQTSK